MIHVVYYRSQATFGPAMDHAAEIQSILAVARERNAALDVTGALVFSDNRFFQVLEGKRAAVEQLMTHISRDPRHGGISLLFSASRDARRFGGWSMAYVGADPERLGDFGDLTLDTLPVIDRARSAGVLRTMIEGTR